MKYIDYLFEVIDEGSELCGELFFVEVLNDENALEMAWDIACENFPDVELECVGTYTPSMAREIGYDTF